MGDDAQGYLLPALGALRGYAELSIHCLCNAMKKLHDRTLCILDMVGPLPLVAPRVRRLEAACLAQHGLLLGFRHLHV